MRPLNAEERNAADKRRAKAQAEIAALRAMLEKNNMEFAAKAEELHTGMRADARQLENLAQDAASNNAAADKLKERLRPGS